MLFLVALALSNLSWQSPAQVRTVLAQLSESGDELSIALKIQLPFVPKSDQVEDQTPLISSSSESGSDLSLALHSIATILLNLNLASRSGSAKLSVCSISMHSNALPNGCLENFIVY